MIDIQAGIFHMNGGIGYFLLEGLGRNSRISQSRNKVRHTIQYVVILRWIKIKLLSRTTCRQIKGQLQTIKGDLGASSVVTRLQRIATGILDIIGIRRTYGG